MWPEESEVRRRQPRLQLAIVDRHDAICDGCGGDLVKGTEAARWVGRTLIHVSCALDPGAPKGGL